MLPKTLSFLSKIKNLKIILLRYILYGLGFIDILILPKLLEPHLYANFEYYKNLIYLFPNILLGASSGYIYMLYVKKKDEFETLYNIGIIVSITSATFIGMFTHNYLIILPLIIINIYTVIEQKLKVTRNFFEAFLFKPLLSLVVLILCFINFLHSENLILFASFSITCFIWLLFVLRKVSIAPFFPKKEHFISFFFLIKKSISITLCSLTLLLLMFSERFFIDEFYNFQLPSYSFSFNLAQIVVIIISVFSYLATIDKGEQLDQLSKKDLLRSLRFSIVSYFIFFFFYFLAVYFLSRFYSKFDNIILMTSIIAFGKGFNTLVGIFSPIAVYKNYNNEMLIVILLVFLINVGISYIMAKQNVSLIIILTINSLCIFFYSLYILNIVFRRISY